MCEECVFVQCSWANVGSLIGKCHSEILRSLDVEFLHFQSILRSFSGVFFSKSFDYVWAPSLNRLLHDIPGRSFFLRNPYDPFVDMCCTRVTISQLKRLTLRGRWDMLHVEETFMLKVALIEFHGVNFGNFYNTTRNKNKIKKGLKKKLLKK